ncbi:arsenosugar biosynthesis radical SAM (seleno)protein ArsS [Geotalea toluenoxydans]|uniref:arsenosugar biosynthesis radical SAM (seleno)protein ArsS n=1 Tax=Geotalea toluenoxydans TaxID=421624 RepID=UPI0006D0FABD|nr:arsenosugar biosynthesis radical SAM (seleno)protein ArsS [Geotalea toluenoxydans]
MVAAFKERLQSLDPVYITFDSLQTLQLNLGNLCNMSCRHCHVNASPQGREIMGKEVMDKVIAFLSRQPGIALDVTGGCPEMNPHFRYLMEATAGLSPRRIVRSNLTIMEEPEMAWLPEFYSKHGIVITASLPCYLEENIDRQRGQGVHAKSIAALKRLNEVGYGYRHELNLVYNPGEAFIPGSQKELEAAYKVELFERHGITFDHLYAITNAPIGRFREYLESKGALDRYLNLLATSFNPDAARNLMCRTLVSVDWQGFIYNCDFNQAVGMPITNPSGCILKIDDLEQTTKHGAELFLAQHCYCCTAGSGSSCTGATA